MFRKNKLLDIFPKGEEIILYGEGYGNKIQLNGEKYREDASFILFDVKVNGLWLEQKNVKNIANKLNIDVVPDLGIKTIPEIIELVKSEFQITINGHIIPKSIQEQAALGSSKTYTAAKISFGESIVTNIEDVDKRPTA